MIPLVLSLVGCHVFEAVEIQCASDEACAQADTDTDTDADTDTDTDADTDTDTGPLFAPTRGWVLSGASSGGNRVVVMNPVGETVAAWTDLGDAAGPVGFDIASGDAVLAYASTLYHLDQAGGVSVATGSFPDTLDLTFVQGVAYMANGANVVAWDSASDSTDTAFASSLRGVSGVGASTTANVYITDTDGGSPDLYQWSSGAEPTTLYTDFDGNSARARIVFAGPADAPHTCSTAGAIYAVSGLAEGNSRPLAYYSGGLTDVSACAYDPGDETWLLFSPTVGVIRLDAQSRSEIVFAPTSSYTLVRGSFY